MSVKNNVSRICAVGLLLVGVSASGAALLGASPVLWAQAEKPAKKEKLKEMYSASAFSRILGPRGVVGVTFYVDEYSTDEEVKQLAETLRTQGPKGLLSAVTKLKGKGRLAPVGSVGNDVKVIRMRQTDKGRLYTMVTDRNLAFIERYQSYRSVDYPFGVIQFTLNEKGEGEGVMLAAAKISFNKEGAIEVEYMGIDPVKLMNVRKEK